MEGKLKQEEFPDMPHSSRALQEAIRMLDEKNKLKEKSPKEKLHDIAEEIRNKEKK
jgi:hypothetical protein